jgi:hypothetical protein
MELTKEKIEKFIDDFEKDPITVKWIESVDNRGKYQREMDKGFYTHVQSNINKLCKLIILMSTTQNGADIILNNIKKEQDKNLEILGTMEEVLITMNNANKS